MSIEEGTWESSKGQLTITAGRRSTVGISSIEEYEYHYQPPARLAGQIPTGLAVTMRCVVADDGVRRFFPAGGWQEFLANASVIGLAILDDERQLGAWGRSSYRAMFQVFRLVRQMPEHLDRRFARLEDLVIHRSCRIAVDEKDVLPHELLVGDDCEPRITCRQVIRCGRQTALSLGRADATTETVIRYGLAALAQDRPLLNLSAGEVADLVRGSLFANAIPKDIEEPLIEQVAARLIHGLERHADDSPEEFDHWLVSNAASWIKNIANCKQCAGGTKSSELVRQVVLLLGWRAYRYVADCLLGFTKWFLAALPEPLTDVEWQRFIQVYGCQPHFGNLPLVLLAERNPTIAPVVSQLIENPDDEMLIGTLHSLLALYSFMACTRREADCKSKQLKRDRKADEKSKQTAEGCGAKKESECCADDDAETSARARKSSFEQNDMELALINHEAPTEGSEEGRFAEIANVLAKKRKRYVRCVRAQRTLVACRSMTAIPL